MVEYGYIKAGAAPAAGYVKTEEETIPRLAGETTLETKAPVNRSCSSLPEFSCHSCSYLVPRLK